MHWSYLSNGNKNEPNQGGPERPEGKWRKGGAGSGWSVSVPPPDCGESSLKLIPRLSSPLFSQVPLSSFLPELKYQGARDRGGDWRS